MYYGLAVSEAEVLNAEGTECAKRGDLEEALALYERALLLDPTLAKAENNRGNILRRLDRVEEATRAFERARELGSEKAVLNLASLLAQTGRLSEIDVLVSTLRPDEAADEVNLWAAVARTTTWFIRDAAEMRRRVAAGEADTCDERTFAGGLRVALPKTQTITHHVLAEREDWFEDEIRFVRKLLQPGDIALDVGANFGVFTLSMARAVGPGGKIVAVEPAWATRTFLEESLRRNSLSNVTVMPYALSNEAGSATFFNASSPELSGLAGADVQDGTREVVALRTLEEVATQLNLPSLSFMKLDAEGEEVRILEGAQRFLDAHEPLLMTELVHGTTVNRGLLERLVALKMELFCLAPGPMLLQPLTEERVRAGFLLNVFACRPSRRDQLASRGLLGRRAGTLTPDAATRQAARAHVAALEPHGTAQGMLREAAEHFALSAVSSDAGLILEGLEQALSLSVTASAGGRASLGTLLFLARVAAALGQRSISVSVALRALAHLDTGDAPVGTDIVVGPSPRFDRSPVGASLEAWVRASLLDHLLHEKAYSSMFDPSLVELAHKALEGPYEQPLASRIIKLFPEPHVTSHR